MEVRSFYHLAKMILIILLPLLQYLKLCLYAIITQISRFGHVLKWTRPSGSHCFRRGSGASRKRMPLLSHLMDPQSLRNDINQSKRENRGKVLAGKKQKLLTWLNSMSLQDILSWFDAIEMTEVSSQIKAKRWNTEVLERDRMFLQMLGVEINT